MSDNLSTNVQLESNGKGTVSFATEVVATIAGLATIEVEGVASMWSPSGIADMLSFKKQQSRNLTRGVSVNITENMAKIVLTIVIDYGFTVPEVAGAIQKNVKKAVETMSGLTVESVDVQVQAISFEREQQAAAELEQQQSLLLKAQSDASDTAEEDLPEAAPETEEQPQEPQENTDPNTEE